MSVSKIHITPKNKEQENAIQMGVDFLDKGNPEEFMIIVGKAGTGKTTIAQHILEKHIGSKNILVCALSHKAKLVITEKLIKAYGDRCVISKSVAGALGMNMDNETGKFVLSAENEREPAIRKANIIIVDEGSMINEESHRLIMSNKRKKARVIYLGDIRQLPPIRENGDPNSDKPSPVFYSEMRAVLTERVRQGEESPILPFADYFGNNSRLKYPVLDPVPPEARQNIVTDNGALVFADNTADVLEAVLPLYKTAVDTGNMNIVKTVSYRNETRRDINNSVRSYLFDSNEQFVIGELVMFSDNYDVSGFEEPISNSFEVQLTSASSMIDSNSTANYRIWEVEFIYESRPVTVKVLDFSETKRHAADVSMLFEKAKRERMGSEERKEALDRAWGLKKRYAPIEYAYAITSHKCQGSTYNTVVVDERDIMSVTMISNKQKSQSMYVAITRAATTCIVISKRPADESLEAAVTLSNLAIKNNQA